MGMKFLTVNGDTKPIPEGPLSNGRPSLPIRFHYPAGGTGLPRSQQSRHDNASYIMTGQIDPRLEAILLSRVNQGILVSAGSTRRSNDSTLDLEMDFGKAYGTVSD